MNMLMRLVQSRVAVVKELLQVPPFSESMAGVIILFVFTNSVASSIWSFNSWSPFIFTLFGGSNLYVGLMAMCHGIFDLCFALASGHVADTRLGASRTLVYAVYFGIGMLGLVLLGIWTESLLLLVVAQCCVGIYMGLSFTSMESVFAQCLTRGDRDRLYSVKFSCESAGPIVGLILSFFLYTFFGNEWKVPVLRWIMTAGITIHLSSMVTFLYHFKPLPKLSEMGELSHAPANKEASDVVIEDVDAAPAGDSGYHAKAKNIEATLGECMYEEDMRAAHNDEGEGEVLTAADAVEISNRARKAMLYSRGEFIASRYDPSVCTASPGAQQEALRDFEEVEAFPVTSDPFAAPNSEEMEDQVSHSSYVSVRGNREVRPSGTTKYVDTELAKAKGCRRQVMLAIPFSKYPFVVAAADMVIIVGSGMTTQYFTMFMMVVYDVPPAMLAFLNLCNSCLIAVLAIIIGTVGSRYGRVRAIIPPKVLGALTLLWMALTRKTAYSPTWMMCIAYVIRNALMNCSAGLSRALIMDIVPPEHRGRWNAVESVQSAGWSGTALIGGFLADRWGYGGAFIITFMFHTAGIIILSPLTVRNDTKLPVEVTEPAEPEEREVGAAPH